MKKYSLSEEYIKIAIENNPTLSTKGLIDELKRIIDTRNKLYEELKISIEEYEPIKEIKAELDLIEKFDMMIIAYEQITDITVTKE